MLRAKQRPTASATILPRIRVMKGKQIALGPGKAELLANIQATGSIAHAAESMGMSYMRAWLLIRTMNKCFKSPLVKTARGGQESGGATLTPVGERVLALYQRIESESLRATADDWNELRKLLRS
jgi:molybdate transport system regulatory protein